MPLAMVPVDDSAIEEKGGKRSAQNSAPVGLSLLGSFGEDIFLLDVACAIATALTI